MKRFFIFPVGVALIFLQWRVISLAEFLMMIWPDTSARNPRQSFGETYLSFIFAFEDANALMLQLILPGIVAGLSWAITDYFKHRPRDETAVRFALNLFWCWLYGTIFIASGSVLCFGILSYYVQNNSRAPIEITLAALGLCFLINGSASIVAIAGTLSTSHIFSPRFVSSELRKSGRSLE